MLCLKLIFSLDVERRKKKKKLGKIWKKVPNKMIFFHTTEFENEDGYGSLN